MVVWDAIDSRVIVASAGGTLTRLVSNMLALSCSSLPAANNTGVT